MTGPALAAIAEANRIGITLAVLDGKLRFRPRDRMTPDLLRRLTAHRDGVLAVLAMSEPPAPEPEPWPQGRPAWVDRIMAGPVAKATPELHIDLQDFAEPGDAGTIGYREHLARIRRTSAAKARSAKSGAGESPMLDATEVARPMGGPDRA